VHDQLNAAQVARKIYAKKKLKQTNASAQAQIDTDYTREVSVITYFLDKKKQ